MALPYQFANATTATGAQLDADLQAAAVLGVLPCTVAGTNTLTLTLAVNTPTISAYANYLRFSGVAAASNTSTVTAQIGSLTALPVYKDSPSGPIALSGGEIIAGNAFTLVYDSALNSGNGGFHLVATTAVNGTAINASLIRVNSGASLVRMLGIGSLATLAFTVVPANSTQDVTVSFTGVALNDSVMVGMPSNVSAGLNFTGFVPAGNSVIVRAINVTSTTITPPTNPYALYVLGFAG